MDSLTLEALPDKQRLVLDTIVDFLQRQGYPPTIQQLCDACGVSSTSTIHYHLTALKKKGFIHWNESERRAITVNETFMRPPHQLPVCGVIAAGLPVQAYNEAEETLDLTTDICPSSSYALRVKGDSMIEDHIMEGDLVLVNPDVSKIRQGDVVVAVVDGETTTLKRFYREPGGRVRLQPANETLDPIIVFEHQVTLQGKVEGLIRRRL